MSQSNISEAARQKAEAESFLRRVQTEYPHLNVLGTQAIVNATVTGMQRLGIYRDGLNAEGYMAGLRCAMDAGVLPKPPLETQETAETQRRKALETIYPSFGLDPGHKDADINELLVELQGYEITPQNVQNAILRIQGPQSKFSVRKRGQLHFAPAPVRTDARQHASDGEPFLGKHINEPEWARLSRQRAERDKANHRDEVSLDATESRWKEMSVSLLNSGNTHSDRAAIQQTFDEAVRSGRGWRYVYETVEKAVKQIEKSRQMLR